MVFKLKSNINDQSSIQIIQNLNSITQIPQKEIFQMFSEYSSQQSLYESSPIQSSQTLEPSNFYIKQLEQIQAQTELIQKIISKLPKQKETSQIQQLPSQSELQCSIMKKSQSMVSIYSLSFDLNNICLTTRNQGVKFAKRQNKHLREVREKCSVQTYDYLLKIVDDSKKQERQKQIRIKQKQNLELIQQENILLKNQLHKLQKEIQALQVKMHKIENEKSQISKKWEALYKKQEKMLKRQEMLLHQRKACKSLQKQIRYQMNRLQQLFESLEKKLDNSFNSNGSQINIQEPSQVLQQCQSTSKSTIDQFTYQKPQISDLWSAIHKLQRLSSVCY